MLLFHYFIVKAPAIWQENAYISDYIIMPPFWQQIAIILASK
jgi:hypothetical protein